MTAIPPHRPNGRCQSLASCPGCRCGRVAGPWRLAQQVLESGGSKPYELATGWLGRALAAHGNRAGLALTTAVPLVLRGSERIDTWAPSALPEPSPDLVARLESLYDPRPWLHRRVVQVNPRRADGERPGEFVKHRPPRTLVLDGVQLFAEFKRQVRRVVVFDYFVPRPVRQVRQRRGSEPIGHNSRPGLGGGRFGYGVLLGDVPVDVPARSNAALPSRLPIPLHSASRGN